MDTSSNSALKYILFRKYGQRFGKIAELEFMRKTMSKTQEDSKLISKLSTLSGNFADTVAKLQAKNEPLSDRIKARATDVDKAITAVNELIGATFL